MRLVQYIHEHHATALYLPLGCLRLSLTTVCCLMQFCQFDLRDKFELLLQFCKHCNTTCRLQLRFGRTQCTVGSVSRRSCLLGKLLVPDVIGPSHSIIYMAVNLRVSLLGLRMQVITPVRPTVTNTNGVVSPRRFCHASALGLCRHLRVFKSPYALASPIWRLNLCVV